MTTGWMTTVLIYTLQLVQQDQLPATTSPLVVLLWWHMEIGVHAVRVVARRWFITRSGSTSCLRDMLHKWFIEVNFI